MAAVVPCLYSLIYLVRLINGVNGGLIVPEARDKILVRSFLFVMKLEETYCSIETLFPTPPNSP